jgi:hypothetical protein
MSSSDLFIDNLPIIDVSKGLEGAGFSEDPAFMELLSVRYADMMLFMTQTKVQKMSTQIVNPSTGATYRVFIDLTA